MGFKAITLVHAFKQEKLVFCHINRRVARVVHSPKDEFPFRLQFFDGATSKLLKNQEQQLEAQKVAPSRNVIQSHTDRFWVLTVCAIFGELASFSEEQTISRETELA